MRAADTAAMLGTSPLDVGGCRNRPLLLCARARERAPDDESGNQCPDQGRDKRGARIGDHVSQDEPPLRVGDVPDPITRLVDVRRDVPVVAVPEQVIPAGMIFIQIRLFDRSLTSFFIRFGKHFCPIGRC